MSGVRPATGTGPGPPNTSRLLSGVDSLPTKPPLRVVESSHAGEREPRHLGEWATGDGVSGRYGQKP